LDLLLEYFLDVGSIVGAADIAAQVVALQPAVDDIEAAEVVGLDEVSEAFEGQKEVAVACDNGYE
tara:strand:+ start:446 stop:640 length:195 start_codon:yes stop_codon:yes gene_type:complete